VLLEETVLPHLTTGLEFTSSQAIYLYSNADDQLLCSFTMPFPIHINHDAATIQVSIFITSNLAFQAMIMGTEAMAGQHCLMCQLSQKEFNDDTHIDG
jgi:hypothetical protein